MFDSFRALNGLCKDLAGINCPQLLREMTGRAFGTTGVFCRNWLVTPVHNLETKVAGYLVDSLVGGGNDPDPTRLLPTKWTLRTLGLATAGLWAVAPLVRLGRNLRWQANLAARYRTLARALRNPNPRHRLSSDCRHNIYTTVQPQGARSALLLKRSFTDGARCYPSPSELVIGSGLAVVALGASPTLAALCGTLVG